MSDLSVYEINAETAKLADIGSRTAFNKPVLGVIEDLEKVGSTLTREEFNVLVEAGIRTIAMERMKARRAASSPDATRE